jgi:hypothetical protein
MALKYKFKSKEEIPGEHQAFYAEREGAWVLDVEGAVDKTKLDEFRSNNVALLKEMEELKAKFAGVDPEEVKRMAEDKRKLEEEAARKAGDFDKMLQGRVKPLQEQLQALSAERDALHGRLADLQINQGAVAAATKRGLRPTAMADLALRVRSVFRLENGVPRAFEADGKTPKVGKDGVSPVTLDEWVEGLAAEAPHLFAENAGGGASGASRSGQGGSGAAPFGENPWKRESFNLTRQGEIVRKDPSRAKALMAAARS